LRSIAGRWRAGRIQHPESKNFCNLKGLNLFKKPPLKFFSRCPIHNTEKQTAAVREGGVRNEKGPKASLERIARMLSGKSTISRRKKTWLL